MVVLIIGIEGDHIVAEKPRGRRPGVGDQGLVLGQCQRERVSQERLEMTLTLLGFCPWSAESQERIICLPDGP
jgi:hypothetical protein